MIQLKMFVSTGRDDEFEYEINEWLQSMYLSVENFRVLHMSSLVEDGYPKVLLLWTPAVCA